MQRQYFLNQFRSGNPAFISSGGIIVPNKARTTPHFRKISKLNGVTCVTIENEYDYCTPRSIYKLRCALEILLHDLQ
jgi:hypothetical protein